MNRPNQSVQNQHQPDRSPTLSPRSVPAVPVAPEEGHGFSAPEPTRRPRLPRRREVLDAFELDPDAELGLDPHDFYWDDEWSDHRRPN